MSNDGRKVAFITGASRGIGKAVALYLARAGFDVAVTARTVHPGEEREVSSTVKRSDVRALPGSLDETAALVRGEGREVMVVPADLLDYASLGAAVTKVLERWGRVDVLVNNGRYIGPGHMDKLLETPIEILEKHFQANVLAGILLAQYVIPGMIERGDGRILNITSASGYADPTKAAGEGGWGFGYGSSKAAFHRAAGMLAIEHGHQGVCAFNIQPGYIATERIAATMAQFGFGEGGAPPDILGAVCAWLATSDEAKAMNGQNIEAQFFCHERGLLPGWPGPEPNTASIKYDLAGWLLHERERELLEKSKI